MSNTEISPDFSENEDFPEVMEAIKEIEADLKSDSLFIAEHQELNKKHIQDTAAVYARFKAVGIDLHT
ncbi:hypothetical protein HON22_01900 [Candidatus Peregrinibacteria bacterium]|jgi:hypothetical protein|nr:hypothetical protein [Candidatus Peregrinibacteria bacterium]